ncbi:MAG TPA: hypothetical protein VJW73_13205, partial [Gemmatimonadaceae bacterium]|nr:hypothetical protein [Gemmatimonadaceae bacterium]
SKVWISTEEQSIGVRGWKVRISTEEQSIGGATAASCQIWDVSNDAPKVPRCAHPKFGMVPPSTPDRLLVIGAP